MLEIEKCCVFAEWNNQVCNKMESGLSCVIKWSNEDILLEGEHCRQAQCEPIAQLFALGCISAYARSGIPTHLTKNWLVHSLILYL